MTSSLPRCPDCRGKVAFISPIPATDVFAGRTLGAPISGGGLYRCLECQLGFRWPRLDKVELDKLYESGDDLTWADQGPRRYDWQIARAWVERELDRGGGILDVGCFDGGFLEGLVHSYDCNGIEIHAAACDRAEKKGIKIIGNDFSCVTGVYDCITAFDVIEHVEKPREFLAECLGALRSGGFIIISTGNLDALSFRMMGGRYWYCTISEHISFLSPKWFHVLSKSSSFRILRQTTYAHSNSSWVQKMREAVINVIYRIWRPGFRVLRTIGMGGKNVKQHPELAEHPPIWASAPDHFMVLLQKE